MQLVNLNTNGMCYNNVLLLKNEDDLLKFKQFYQNDVSKVINTIMKSDVNPDRWDHVHINSPAGLTFTTAVAKSKVVGGNPLFMMDEVTEQVFESKFKLIGKGKYIVQKQNGSYFHLDPDSDYDIEVVEEDHEFGVATSHVIKKNTKYINLENDPKLEQHTIDFMDKVDPNFSYILNLRDYDFEKLKGVFKQFKNSGGQSLYLYTTGLDTNQMKIYIKSAIKSGVTKGLFHFNTGYSEDVVDVMKSFENKMEIEYEFI